MSTSARELICDVHAHAHLAAVDAVVAGHPGLEAQRELDRRRNGAQSSVHSVAMVKQRIGQLTSITRRLADMDGTGVDIQVVSPEPTQYHYWADEALARAVCHAANDEIAELAGSAPGRLHGLGLVPLQHPGLLVAELEYAVHECGLAGVEISSYAAGAAGRGAVTVELSDERLGPFWHTAEELGALVFIHPFGCSLDERLDRYYLANTVGQPAETAVALSHLIFGGVLDRHPELRVLAAHGGGYLPYYLGRSDHAWSVRPEAHGCSRAPSTYLKRLYFDSLAHSPLALRTLLAAAGSDRVLLGSDYPFDMGLDNPVADLLNAGLTAQEQRAVLSANSAQLLSRLPAPILDRTTLAKDPR